MEKVQKNLLEFLDAIDRGNAEVVYSDDAFSRKKYSIEITENLNADVLLDTVKNEQVDCICISLHCEEDTEFSLLFADTAFKKFDWGYLTGDPSGKSELFWLPQGPVSRVYDSNERIVKTSPAEVEISDSAIRLICAGGMRTEFCFVKFSKDTNVFRKEILEHDPFEDAGLVKIRPKIFSYNGLCDVWRYLIAGNIYKLADGNGGLTIRSELTAFSLYYHMSYLNDRFGKAIYSAIRQLIAYTVLLTQDSDGRYRHGPWADKMETHCVFQSFAIDVLVDHYEHSGADVFIQKAKAAADYLIDIADNFSDDRIWFLHDSLELNAEDVRLYYDPFIPTDAFGMSESNTLCLNSHLCTMIVIHRLSQSQGCSQYVDYFDKAMNILKEVLEAKPSGFLYGAIYRLRDAFISMSVKFPNKYTDKLRRKYDSFLKKGWLLRLKVRCPRLVMPNGYTERDLNHSILMTNYHLVNLKQMLCTYRCNRQPWLGEIIKKCVRYTVQSSLVDDFAKTNFLSTMILEILVLYAALFDDEYLFAFVKYARLLRNSGHRLNMDTYSNQQIAGLWNGMSVSSEDIRLFSIPSDGNLKAVLVNISDSSQLFEIEYDKGSFNEHYTVTDLAGRNVNPDEKVSLPVAGIFKIISK
jgi:hypothetical protein